MDKEIKLVTWYTRAWAILAKGKKGLEYEILFPLYKSKKKALKDYKKTDGSVIKKIKIVVI